MTRIITIGETPKGIITVQIDEAVGLASIYQAGAKKGRPGPAPEYIRRQIPEAAMVCGDLTLRAASAAKIEAAMAELQAEYDATPVGQMHVLRRDRKELVNTLTALIEAADDDSRRAIERASAGGRYTQPVDRSAEIEAARRALADFDRANPQILAEINAARAARTDAAAWN